MKNIIVLLFAIYVLSACRSFPVYKEGVDSTGKEVYLVRADSYSREKAKNAVLERANEYCREKGLKMEPSNDKNKSAWTITIKNKHDVELLFNCL